MQGFNLIQNLPSFIVGQRAKNSLKDKAGKNLLVQSMTLYGSGLALSSDTSFPCIFYSKISFLPFFSFQ